MGGQYINEYKYDAQSRLLGAISTINPYNYDFNADYSRAGRFGHGFCRNTGGVADENTIYGYDDQKLTHQPRVIFDYTNGRRTQLAWDANGNLALLWECDKDFTRFHDWDDENRLRMVVGNNRAGYYGYDANGDRVYKLTGTSTITHTSDEVSDAVVYLDSAVLYPNPYMVVMPKGYTKHYYAKGERLASSIGHGDWCYMSPDVISHTQTNHEYDLQKHFRDICQS